MTTPQDEWQRLYDEASSMQEEQPSPAVHVAVMAHAALLAKNRTETTARSVGRAPSAANWPHWKSGLVASVLLAPLLGLLVVQMKDTPQVQQQAAVTPKNEATVASQVAAAQSPPAEPVPARAKATDAPASPREIKPAVPAVAETTKDLTPSEPPPPAALSKEVAAASSGQIADHPTVQATAGASTAAEGRADRAEALLNRSRESAPMASRLAAAPAPSAAPAAAAAKSFNAATGTQPLNAALLQAATQGNVQLVQTLLSEGASLDARDAQGRTPLILASLGGHEALVKRLIEDGANKAAVDQEGLTAAQHAGRLGFAAIARLLQ